MESQDLKNLVLLRKEKLLISVSLNFPSWRERKPKFIVQYNLLQLLLFFAVNL